MPKIDPVLVPEGMNVVYEVTPRCFVDGGGYVVFLRQQEGRCIPMVLKTIYDAISQCFHILDRTVGEVVDFYRRQPSVHAEGEIGQMRIVVLEIQKVIATLISPEGVSERSAEEVQVIFCQIIRRLGHVRNAHKLAVVVNLNQSRLPQGNRPKHLGEVLSPATAHLAALKRFDELLNITEGVVAQARQLIDIARVGEDRIKKVYEILGAYEAKVSEIVGGIEQIQRKAGVKCPPSQLSLLRRMAREIGSSGVNQVNALNGIVRVEPFKSRIESVEVKRLARLDEYLDQWQEGKDSALYTFQRTFGVARNKLKRLVRNRQAAQEQRTLDRRYTYASS